jgi:hypothetical protein
MIFRNGDRLRVAIYGTARGENQWHHLMMDHRIQEIYCIGHVILEISGGVPHRFAHEGMGRKVQYGLERARAKRGAEGISIAQVSAYELAPENGP